MDHDNTTERLLFPELARKRVLIEFDELKVSSDGGAVLLRAADARLGLTEAMASCLKDKRDGDRVQHEVAELVAQRVYAIACGYPDANDAGKLSEDPVHRIALGRDPVEDRPLASQPTISRFENAVSPKELYRVGKALAHAVIERQRRRLHGRARRITIDMDPTDDPTYGEQQLSLFNAHYDNWCYLPQLCFLTFDDEREQYLCAAILRSGGATAKVGAIGLLRRLLPRLRSAFPKANFVVRLDGGFACPEVFEYLDGEPDVRYVVGMAKNKVLQRCAEPLMAEARRLSEQTGKTEHIYGETSYKAGRWGRPRRVIIKAEVVRLDGREPRDNPRFVVTDMRATPRVLYEKVYCQRGEIENRIKELKDGLSIDRTSCTRFWANQLRVFLTAAAYVLMQELRLRAARTKLGRAQVATLRDALLKVGTRVRVSVRRFLLHFPRFFPHLEEWRQVALALGATVG